MSAELAYNEGEPRIATEPPLNVLVRTLTLPTSVQRQAMAAAKLRLDQLSPSPPEEVLVDVALLGEGGSGQTRWAIGIARRAEVVRLCEAAARESLMVARTVEGREVAFRFRGAFRGYQLPERLKSGAAPAAALLCGLAALLAALSVRADREMRSEGLGDGAAAQIADQSWRVAADRDIAIRSWINANRQPAAPLALCGLSLVDRAMPGPKPVVSLDASPGALTLVLAGRSPPSLAQTPGVTVSTDGGAAERQMIRVAQEACPERVEP